MYEKLLILRGLFRYLKFYFKHQLFKNSETILEERKYYCYPLFLEGDVVLGVVSEQPDLGPLSSYALMHSFEDRKLGFLGALYKFLYGLVSIHRTTNKKITIVIPNFWYFLVIQNLPELGKQNEKIEKLITGIKELLFLIHSNGNIVEIEGRRPHASSMKAAKAAAENHVHIGGGYKLE